MLTPVTKTVLRTLRDKTLKINVTPSGNYVNNGDTLNLAQQLATLGLTDANINFPGKVSDASIESVPGGYDAQLVQGATLATWLIIYFTTAGAQVAAGAYPAALTATPTVISITGPKGRI